MKKNKLLFKFIVLFSLSLLWQCNEKTYVPTQPYETFAELSGTILDLKTLFPVDSVRITTIPETQVVYTDSVGKFLFKKIKTGDYIVIVSKVGYLTDSLTTRLKENEKKEILLKLSHDPVFANLTNDIFVITSKGNVYGYDWETLSLNSELIIGPDAPRNIIFSDDGKIIFVSSYSPNTISIIDANTNSLIKTIAIDGRPNGIAFISQLNRIYVSNATKNQIEVIDLNNYQIIKRIELVDSPYPLVASHSGEIIYTSTILGYFIAISTQDDQIKNSLKFEKELLYNLFISPDDKLAYISSFNGNTIYVVNLNSFSLVKTITEITKFSFPNGSIGGLAVSPNNDFLYFSDGANYVGVIDLRQNKIIKRIEVENWPIDLNISSNGRYLFSLQFGAITIDDPTFKPIPGSINVIDTENMSIVKKVTLPKAAAAAFTINPTLNF